jgi:hypothetical protein
LTWKSCDGPNSSGSISTTTHDFPVYNFVWDPTLVTSQWRLDQRIKRLSEMVKKVNETFR